MAKVAGRVCVGFAHPVVAKYDMSGDAVQYTSGMVLARGVDVKINPETSDEEIFYADNGPAESDSGVFSGGTCDLTVDGLLDEAERFILGLSAPEAVTYGAEQTVNVTKYGEGAVIPDVGIGYIVTYKSGGIYSYVPTILRKAKFKQPGEEHKSSDKKISYQTQKLSAVLFRDDTTKRDWKWKAEAQSTMAAAVAVLDGLLGVKKEE